MSTIAHTTAQKVTAFHLGRDMMIDGKPVGRLSDYARNFWGVTLYVGGKIVRVRKNARIVFA